MAYKLDVPDSIVSSEEHQARTKIRLEAAHSLYESIKSFDISSLKNYKKLLDLPDEIPMNSNPKWRNRPFGAVSTVQKAGCLAFVSKVLLDEFTTELEPMEFVIQEIEQKHYRSWNLANRSKTLSMPQATVEGLKAEFPDDKEIQNCNTLDEIYAVAGEPVGIGGNMFFIDNLLYAISDDGSPIEVYTDTRIFNVDELLGCLESDCPVPFRVGNAIYRGDSNAVGGHYATLYGFDNGEAVIVDSNIDQNGGIYRIPIRQLFDAMTENPDLVCAWDTSSLLLF